MYVSVGFKQPLTAISTDLLTLVNFDRIDFSLNGFPFVFANAAAEKRCV